MKKHLQLHKAVKLLFASFIILFFTALSSNSYGQAADLIIQKTGPNVKVKGDTMQFFIKITNNGPSAVTNASFNDNFVAGITDVSFGGCTSTGGATCPTAADYTISNSNFSGTVPFLPVNGEVIMTINLRAPGGTYQGSSFSNTATVATPSGVTEVDPNTNSSTWNVTLLDPKLDIEVIKTQSTNANIGSCDSLPFSVDYTIQWVNHGPAAADGFRIRDYIYLQPNAYTTNGYSATTRNFQIPWNITNYQMTSSSSNTTVPTQSLFNVTSGTRTIAAQTFYYLNSTSSTYARTVPQWAVGDTVTLTYTLTLDSVIKNGCGAHMNFDLVNNANLYSASVGGTTDTNTSNNSSLVTNDSLTCDLPVCPPQPKLDIEVIKTQSTNANIGSCDSLPFSVDYTIQWVNHGPAAADGFRIRDYIYLQPNAYTTNGYSATTRNFQIPWNITNYQMTSSSSNTTVPTQSLFNVTSGTRTIAAQTFYYLNSTSSTYARTVPQWAVGDTVTLTYTLTLDSVIKNGCGAHMNFDLVNNANLYSASAGATTDTNTSNNSSLVTNDSLTCDLPVCPPQPKLDIEVIKVNTPNTKIGACEDLPASIHYEIHWVNHGPSPADGFRIRDYIYLQPNAYTGASGANFQVPWNITNYQMTSSSSNTTVPTQSLFNVTSGTRTIAAQTFYYLNSTSSTYARTVPQWAVGDTITLSYDLNLSEIVVNGCGAYMNFDLVNQANLYSASAGATIDTNTSNNSSSVTNDSLIASSVDLAISKSVNPATSSYLDTLDMQTIFQNASGAQLGSGVYWIDTLPQTVKVLPSTITCSGGGGATCTPVMYDSTTRIMRQDFSTFPAGGIVTVDYKAIVVTPYTLTQDTRAYAIFGCPDCIPSTNITETNFQMNGVAINELGNYVWYDSNQNGLQETGEVGVAGITVTLYDNSNDSIVGTTVTDANGLYLFNDLYDGTYYVQFSLPQGFEISPQDAGSDDAVDSDADPLTGLSGTYTLSGGQTDLTVDAGIFASAPTLSSLGDRVWYDANGDGIQDAGELGVQGVTVYLCDASGTTQLDSTTTDGLGNYIFTGLAAGTYSVGFANLPAGYVFSPQDADSEGLNGAGNSDANTTTGKTDSVVLAAGEDNMNVDAGIIPPSGTAGLGDYVWYDLDQDGLQDANEPPVPGVQVMLFDNNDNIVGVTTTDQNGKYQFVGLTPGDYYLRFNNLPNGYALTTFNTNGGGIDDSLNSDVQGNALTPVVTLSSGEYNPNIDGGIITNILASVGDYVWWDDDEDGIQDANEEGVGGVQVTLYDNTNTAVATTVTKPDGSYLFINVQPGTYTMGFSNLPDSTALTVSNSGSNDSLDSDPNTTTGLTSSFVVTGGTHNPTLDAGIYKVIPVNTLGDRVWNDLDKDGIQDATEVGVAGITVTLCDDQGIVIGTTVTDAYGNYLFEDLVDGDYKVGFTLPANYVFTQQNTPGDNGDNTNSDVDPTTGKTASYNLAGGETDLTADAGIYFETVTPPASVGDYVWYDTNMDGVQDTTEVGISGVTVTLCDASGNPVATTITDGDGKYLFTDVTPGTYSVGFTPPAGLGFSPNTGGVSVANNSDANPTTGKTSTFTVNAGDQIREVDAGLHSLPTTVGSLGDKVWYDENQDGIQDVGEVGAAGVVVTLYDSTGTNVLSTTTTDGFGNYIFSNLNAGKYVVGFTVPSGYTISPEGAGSDSTVNSDANTTTGKTSVIMLAQGEHNPTIDAGIFNSTPANNNSIGDYVWHDEDHDGVQDASEEGVSGITVTLCDNTGSPIATTTTDANGYYSFPFLPNGTYSVGFSNLPEEFVFSEQNAAAGTAATDSDPDPQTGKTSTVSLTGNTHITDLDAGIFEGEENIGTASLGDLVWYDTDGDGIQDPEELGVSGVTVYLYDSAGTTILDSTVTDALGNYIFTDLDPDTYCVQFTNTPAGFTFSPQDADSEGTNGADNSDVNTTTGKSNPIVLTEGEDNLNIDAGLVPPTGTAGLGDKVWYDLDKDGLQDANEPGVPGIQVCLLDNTGSTIAVTTTDINGNYQFIGLTPGDYQVGFKNLPSGYVLTMQDADNAGLNGTMNSDADSTTGLTSTITLTSGQYNPNVDAGIQTTTVGSVGDYVWCDENGDGIQDANEPGVGGVLVTLYDSQNDPVASTLTDENGAYLFSNLQPEVYSIGFTNLPSSKEFTTQDAGTNDSTDSDANPTTGRTGTFTVNAGEHVPTIDAGLRTPIPCGLGNYVWHDFNEDGVQDANEPPVSGVLVTLYGSDGTTVLAQAITDGNGYYQFDQLPAGTYSVGFSNLPDGSTPTQSNGSLNTTDNSDMDPDTKKTASVVLGAGEFNPNLDGGIYFGSPLPVRLASFTVSEDNCGAVLNWVTLSEENTSHFDVMRSKSGASYKKIGEVKAAGNSSVRQEYSYEDDNLNGEYTYKLSIVDIDGQLSESPTRSLRVVCPTNGLIRLYPNPVEDQLEVQSTLENADFYTIRLRDITGRVLYESKREIAAGRDVFQVPMSQYASGSYLLEIHSEGNGKHEFKVQKK